MLRVSIVTICFNSVDTIENTIESVLNQNYPNIEYIIIDGSSQDGTKEIINNYSSQIATFISEPDSGLYDAMNKGIKASTGDIIGFINSDDMLSNKSVIRKIVKCFEESNANIVYGDKKYVKRYKLDQTVRYWRAGTYRNGKFQNGWMPPHLSTYIKKSLYDKYGLFRTDLKIAADYELLLRFIVKYKNIPVYLPTVIAVMRQGGISNSSIKNRLQSLREVYISWKLNDLEVSPLIVFMKPFRKVLQFFKKN